MHTLFKAGMAFAIAALLNGTLPPLSPRWRAVAEELHQAEPQAKVKSRLLTMLSHPGKG